MVSPEKMKNRMKGLTLALSEGRCNGLHGPTLGPVAITLRGALTGLRIGETAALGTLLRRRVPHRRGPEPEHQ